MLFSVYPIFHGLTTESNIHFRLANSVINLPCDNSNERSWRVELGSNVMVGMIWLPKITKKILFENVTSVQSQERRDSNLIMKRVLVF